MLSLWLAAAWVTSPLPTTTGTLVIVGGGATTRAMTQRFFQAIGGNDQPIVVIPLMRESPKESGPLSAEWLRENGATNVSLVTDISFALRDRRALAGKILRAKGVWLPGGDQNLFMERLGLEWTQNVLQRAFRGGTSFFGTSAGAMLMSDPMIGGTDDQGKPIQARGAGLVPFLIDSHFRERNRQARLQYALENWNVPSGQGVGLSEGNWIVVTPNGIETNGEPDWFRR